MVPSYSPASGSCFWPWMYIHLLQHHFTYTKPKHVLMQQAAHSFVVLHMHDYLCWVSKLVSWAWINSQGRVLVTATRADAVLFQHGAMPASVQSPAAEQSMLSKWRRTSLVDNIAKQKITISWEVLRFLHLFLFHCRNVTVSFLHARWLTKLLRITKLPRGQFLDCHQVPENCHVRLWVTLDLWVLNANIRLTCHLCFTEAINKGCSIPLNMPYKYSWSYKVFFNLTVR